MILKSLPLEFCDEDSGKEILIITSADNVTYCNTAVDETEPEVEVWDEEEQDILSDLAQPPDLPDDTVQFDAVPRTSQTLALWLFRFMQAAFKLSDVVIGNFLKFFVVFFKIIGRFNNIGLPPCTKLRS